MQISVTSDIEKITRHLNDLQKNQIPYAAARAINDTTAAAVAALKVQAAQSLDRPTNQTLNAFRVLAPYATKRTPVGAVYVLDWAWQYLQYQVEGGTRLAKGKGTGVPTVNQRLNQYGNIPGRRKGLIKKKSQFIATLHGVTGVWERSGRGGRHLKLIDLIAKQVQYHKRLPYHETIQRVVRSTFASALATRLNAALLTAR